MAERCRQDHVDEEALEGFHLEFIREDRRADIVFDSAGFQSITDRQGRQLDSAFRALEALPDVHVIVLRASGEHFCRGGSDVSAHATRAADWKTDGPARCTKPVIAACRGYCFGAGFELALASDFRIATQTTLYAFPSDQVVQIPGAGALQRLAGLVGGGRAREILMRSRYVSGSQAYEWGLATDFAVDSDLESATDLLVQELLSLSPSVQRAAKMFFNEIDDEPEPLALVPAIEACT
jgi:2-oxoglutaroyl-CoA hydrolase